MRVLLFISVWISCTVLEASTVGTLRVGRIVGRPINLDRLASQRYAERLTNSSFFTPGKKLIAVTFPYSPYDYSTNITDLEQRPFSGVVFTLDGGYRGFGGTAWTESSFTSDYQALSTMTNSVFSDNFILFRMSLDPFDWFDDTAWNAVLTNTLIVAKAALLGRCVGLFCDAEAPSDQFRYSTAIGNDVYTWGEFTNQVQTRGQDWIETLQSALPRVYVLWSFFWSTEYTSAPGYSAATIQAGLSNNAYALLPAFVNGMLAGATNTTYIVNGGEPGYYYRTEREFTNFAGLYMDTLFPSTYIQPDLLEKWTSQAQNGPPLYPNWLHARRPGTISQSMTDVERGLWHEHNAYWSLKTSDRYVWDWFELPDGLWGEDWQTTEPEPYVLPITYVSSVTSAVAKVTADLPLGFTSESIFDGLKTRALATVPSATVPVAASPPTIDGDTSDAVWGSAVTLSGFMEQLLMTNRTFQATTVKAIYDANNLYVSFVCDEPLPAGMVTNSAADAFGVTQNDSVSVNIQAPDNIWTLRKFAVNPIGTKADFLLSTNIDAYLYFSPESIYFQPRTYSDGDTSFSASASIGVSSWSCEISIPWSDLAITPGSAVTFKAQFGRYRTQNSLYPGVSSYSERTFWGPEYEMRGSWELMYPDLFGTLTLE